MWQHDEVSGSVVATPDRPQSATRRCLVGRVSQLQTAMLRFVIGPDALVVPDVRVKLPGRGFWLSARRDVVETAIMRKVFTKAARQPVSVPVDLADRVDSLLVRQVLDLIGLGNRAGAVVCGYEKVFTAVKSGQIAFLIEACDAAPSGCEKIRRIGRELPVINLFGGATLGAAVGQAEVMHVAVKTGRMAEVLLLEASRLVCYRGLSNGTKIGKS
ncbi:COG2740: Predicted nucleic-acid-binding protein implicated in transcription termination / ribosomal protein L7Ae family protein [invertebrate metagenome]|uniref:COG2740: Predicted nucleic-acid-binding protein implicated in transcription termination / ribosomal protein L7Ae family protein n=1 Tax=invertebrate metagenome TaxID=1711999 RepID=A0A484H783_9ZZZZ